MTFPIVEYEAIAFKMLVLVGNVIKKVSNDQRYESRSKIFNISVI